MKLDISISVKNYLVGQKNQTNKQTNKWWNFAVKVYLNIWSIFRHNHFLQAVPNYHNIRQILENQSNRNYIYEYVLNMETFFRHFKKKRSHGKNRLIVKQFQTVTNLELRLVAMLPVNLFSIPLGIEHIFSFYIPLGIEHIFSFEQTWIQNCFVQNWIESGPDYFQMLSIYFISIAIILFLKGHYSSFEHNNFFGPRLVFLKVFEEDGTGKLVTTGKGLLQLRYTVIEVTFHSRLR